MKNYMFSFKYMRAGFISLLAGLIASIVTSCNKDFLELTPLDSYTEAVVFDDAALATSFVNYGYRLLPWGFQGAGWIQPYSFMIDENSARLASAAVGPILMGDQNPSYLGALDVWTNSNSRSYWRPIKQANEFLMRTEQSKIETNLLARLRAEAKVIRAYAYFQLISNFGGVPLVTKLFTLDDNFNVPRNTYDEVMTFVIKELDEAIPVLPLDYDSKNKGRATQGAAMAIKARALLYWASPLNNPSNDLQKWQNAANAAKAIIDLNKYSLYPDYKTLFMEAGGYNSEVIWARPTNSAIDREARIEQLFYANSWRGYGQVHPIQNLVDDYEMVNGRKISEPGSDYDPQNPYINRDPRFYYTILYDGAPFKGSTIDTYFPGGKDTNEGLVSSWNASETSYYVRKFITESETGYGWDGTSDPLWLWFRYAEVLLNYAEAKLELGDEATCREYINMVRSRPGVSMPPVTESGAALRARLINERRIELVFEEHRFFDVRRWKIAPDVLNRNRNRMYIWKDLATGKKTYEVKLWQTAKFTDKNYLSPIPQSEIEKNPALEQNPGY